MEQKSNYQAELQAFSEMQEIDPVVKKVNKVYGDIEKIYNNFVAVIKKSKDPELLGDGLKILLAYKKSLSSDPLIFLKFIESMSPEKVELAKSLARKGRILKEISKDKDPRLLFGKK